MGRDDTLNIRQIRPEESDDRAVPLRVEVQLGLVDQENPLGIGRPLERCDQKENLQLARAEPVDRDGWSPSSFQEDVEPRAGPVNLLDDIDREPGLLSRVELLLCPRDILHP